MEASITITKLYSLLSEKMKRNCRNLTTYIENKVKEEMEQATKILATKDMWQM